ncbi:terpene synthase family protein [Amycolatopsis sp. cg5]|uniref:terpene synthase family protein n=1 Tax=Amycolatopsis sp. cg5 TaxID=3238802 RepID=UPI0035239FEC
MTREWANRFGLIGTTGNQRRFDQLAYPDLLSYGCTTAAPEPLALFSEWFTYYFLLDDQQDLAVVTGRQQEFNALQDQVKQVLHTRGRGVRDDSVGLVAAIADLSRRTERYVSDEWWHRYVIHAEEVFAAQRQECGYRFTGTFPDLEDFKEVRRKAGAADMVFDIIEACEQIEIPGWLRYSSTCRSYADDLNDFTTWTNDVLGIDRDAAQVDPMNYVLVRQHLDGIPRGEATERVTAEIVRLVHRLPSRRAHVLSAAKEQGAGMFATVERAVDAWQAWAIAVPMHYLRPNSRLFQMDEAAPGHAPEFTADLLGSTSR